MKAVRGSVDPAPGTGNDPDRATGRGADAAGRETGNVTGHERGVSGRRRKLGPRARLQESIRMTSNTRMIPESDSMASLTTGTILIQIWSSRRKSRSQNTTNISIRMMGIRKILMNMDLFRSQHSDT